MSRYELQDLEKLMRQEEQGIQEYEWDRTIIGEDGEPLSKLDVFKQSSEFKNTRAEIEKL